MRRDLGQYLAEKLLDALLRRFPAKLGIQLVDQRYELAVLVIDLRYSGLEFLAPLDQGHGDPS